MNNRQQQIDYLLDRLEAAGKRSTPQRHAVCQVLVEHGGHPTVAEVFERVRAAYPMISQATVYNTIDTLRELGLIQALDIVDHGHTHYDLDLRPHVNVVCTRCDTITDLHTDTLEALVSLVGQRTGYQIETQRGVVMYGLCPRCRGTQHS